MKPALSVVIPTHNRADILARCLHHLATQTIASDLEVIVVSDGHDDATEALCKKIPNADIALSHFKFLEISASHQGVARNRGTELATAPLTLFIGDDIFLEPHACEVHVKTHSRVMLSLSKHEHGDATLRQAQGDTAVLGYTTWDPALGITPVMRWLEESGWQFGYPLLKEYAHAIVPKEIQHRFTYTSHISLPTEIAKRVLFRKDVTLYGWEDIEWGMRLREAGLPLFFEPGARALHHHHITLESSLKRMEVLGESIVHIEKIVPGFDRRPRGWKRLAYTVAAMLPTMAGKHRRAFLTGMQNAECRM